MARTSRIDDPNFAKAVALAYVEGASRKEMCKLFGVSDPDTISGWTRDIRVRAHAAKFAEERVLRIVRKTDTEIEARVAALDEEDIDTILKIRKEYLGNALSAKGHGSEGGVDANVVSDTMDAIEDDPEMAKALADIVNKNKKKV